MKKIITWIAVLDGASARLMEHQGIGKGLQLIEQFSQPDPYSRELGSERPGRTVESVGYMRHAMEITDWHRQEEEEFTSSMADLLNRRAEEKAFDRLILIAEPHTLGLMRQALDHHAKARIHAEIPKDLTHATSDSLIQHLGKVMAV